MRASTLPIAILLCASSLSAPTLRAQNGRTTIVVGVGDAESGAYLNGAQVHLRDTRVGAVTDSTGQARLPRIAAGRYTVDVQRVGYEPLSTPIVLRGEDSVEVVILMRTVARTLSTVTVTDSAIAPPLRPFEERRRRGVGQFVSGAQIDSLPGYSLPALVESHLRNVHIEHRGNGEMIAIAHRQKTEHVLLPGGFGPCYATVYLDGIMLTGSTGGGSPPDLSVIDPTTLAGIEWYSPSEAPPQYRNAGSMGGGTMQSCGVMLIWSKSSK
jgi:hypothetical protein